MTDLITILSTLVLPNGKILIPGLAELVAPLKPGELERYENINFSIADIENASVLFLFFSSVLASRSLFS